MRKNKQKSLKKKVIFECARAGQNIDGICEIDLQITCKSYLRVYFAHRAMTHAQVITTRFKFPACLSANIHIHMHMHTHIDHVHQRGMSYGNTMSIAIKIVSTISNRSADLLARRRCARTNCSRNIAKRV